MRRGAIACVALLGCGRVDFASQPSWWDTAFTKRAQLAISNNAADPLAVGFPIEQKIDLATLDSPTATVDDLRVLYLDPSAHTWNELFRYINYGWLWFDLEAPLDPSATTTDYWLYFGNPAPSNAASTGSKIFDFYDAFAGTAIDGALWAVNGTPSEGNNTLTLNSGDSVRTLATFGPGTAMFAEVTTPDNPELWWGFQRMNDFLGSDPWMLWIERSTADTSYPPGVPPGNVWPEVDIGGITPGIVAGTTAAHLLDGNHHFYTVQRLRDRVVFKYDEQDVYEYALPITYDVPLQIRLNSYGSVPVVFATIHVAQATWPDPTVAIGPTELH